MRKIVHMLFASFASFYSSNTKELRTRYKSCLNIYDVRSWDILKILQLHCRVYINYLFQISNKWHFTYFTVFLLVATNKNTFEMVVGFYRGTVNDVPGLLGNTSQGHY